MAIHDIDKLEEVMNLTKGNIKEVNFSFCPWVQNTFFKGRKRDIQTFLVETRISTTIREDTLEYVSGAF